MARLTCLTLTCAILGALFIENLGYNNTVLNWHREPEKEFHLHGKAFWNDASVIVYLSGTSLSRALLSK
jgi:hypothetical protein